MLISSKIIDRILKFKGFKTDVKLAKLWRVTPTAITNWRNRNSIPFKKIITFCEAEGVSLDYIFTGEGEITKKAICVAEETPIYKVGNFEKRLNKLEEQILEIKDRIKQCDRIRNDDSELEKGDILKKREM